MGGRSRTNFTELDIRDRVSVDGDGCWIWTGPMKRWAKRKSPVPRIGNSSARRVAYDIFVGETFGEFAPRARCKKPLCVNPECAVVRGTSPLQGAITAEKNVRLGVAIRASEFCRNGHPRATHMRQRAGTITCTECDRLRCRRLRDARRGGPPKKKDPDFCPHGHAWAEHGRVNKHGYVICNRCATIRAAKRRGKT